MPDSGNDAQVRVMLGNVADAAAKAAILDYKAHQMDTPREAPLPALVKWLVGAIAAFGSAALIGLGFWLVTSVSTMRETLARMDERMISADTSDNAELSELKRRVATLEQFHQGGGR